MEMKLKGSRRIKELIMVRMKIVKMMVVLVSIEMVGLAKKGGLN